MTETERAISVLTGLCDEVAYLATREYQTISNISDMTATMFNGRGGWEGIVERDTYSTLFSLSRQIRLVAEEAKAASKSIADTGDINILKVRSGWATYAREAIEDARHCKVNVA